MNNDPSNYDYQIVQHWLEDVFHGEDIPPFDETPEFTELLKKVMMEKKEAEKDARAIIKAESDMKNAYDEKTEELKLLTDIIQVNPSTCKRVQSLASLAEKMKLKEPSLTNFLLAMVEGENQEMVSKEKMAISNHCISGLGKKITSTIKTNENLKRNLESFEKIVKTQESVRTPVEKSISFCKNKTADYETRIKKREENLEAVGYEPNLSHTSLVKEAKDFEELKADLQNAESKLEAYQCLPVSTPMTNLIIAEKQLELERLKDEFKKLLETSGTQ